MKVVANLIRENNYKVETTLEGYDIICETNYSSNGTVKFILNWKDSQGIDRYISNNNSASGVGKDFLMLLNKKTRISGTILFGFDIPCLIEALKSILIPINCKNSFTALTSRSQQNKFGIDLSKVNLDFTRIRQDVVVCACDEALIPRDGYRHLAAISPNLEREYQISNRRNEISKYMETIIPIYNCKIELDNVQNNSNNSSNNFSNNNSVNSNFSLTNDQSGICSYRSIKDLLNTLIPIWKKKSILNIGDNIKLKFGGDCHIVTNKYSHVMFTMCLLNEGDEVLKPDKQYCILLYIGKEQYEKLSIAVSKFSNELDSLKSAGFIDQDNITWSIEFYFSGDWKFMALVKGLKAANSKYFCLFCECPKDLRGNLNLQWNISENKKGIEHPSLFPIIELDHWIPDELHVMLRITDVLMDCLFLDLMIDLNEFKKATKILIEKEMQRIGLTHFQFFESKFKGKSWDWTSLTGPDKLIMLQHFDVTKFIAVDRGRKISFLWKEFFSLYQFLCKDSFTDAEIDSFERGMFNPTDITPYMHIFVFHIPEFLRKLQHKGLNMRQFSTSSIEKKNHLHVKLFFGGTTMGGRNNNNNHSVLHDIMSFENRQLYYLINDTPRCIKQRIIRSNP
ncbi:hypothetical protein GLOIN_2v1792135 [Rhizophagus irregularis DAOM 181602=DAOM 197198]|uniref:Uncharacterized protein n=1 Tax=Rhizophagus irregularis (strain DAOM 181602 / DAOM 197198 / MUCL 43194) TaxID=747089 RepID=A0A2P4NLG5_RHIID|nr:hypothetical protein GLOIN_2v1792135 [Rhizophagus irregularis DAOM 181602=DAOM 197198]POG53961.1 hypothetical protein GLOIN_2v1792135 [Rhizophagus irregularis DAOM 181602=DAOM 197198]|eukprot:XP_025164198.1 hypothetical protein GLOIN_2v1792135 [Rhizophagus irregularis DAOM 181602=DAOM 197198]